MDAVALAAGKGVELLLLVGAGEAEAGDVGPAVDLDVAELELFRLAADRLPDVLVVLQIGAGLLEVRELDSLADLKRAGVGHLLAGDEAEERGVAGAIGANDADNPARRQREVDVLEQQPIAVDLGDAL